MWIYFIFLKLAHLSCVDMSLMVPSLPRPTLRAKGMGSLLTLHGAGLYSLQAKAFQKPGLGHPKKG